MKYQQDLKGNKLKRLFYKEEIRMKFSYYNDTQRAVGIHPATKSHGTECEMSIIKHGEIRDFELPEGTYPWVKMWDYGEKHGLQILVSPTRDDKSENDKPKHMGKYPIEFSFTNEETGLKLLEFCEDIMKKQDVELEIVSLMGIIKGQVKRHLGK
jgi:hypothetical protein